MFVITVITVTGGGGLLSTPDLLTNKCHLDKPDQHVALSAV